MKTFKMYMLDLIWQPVTIHASETFSLSLLSHVRQNVLVICLDTESPDFSNHLFNVDISGCCPLASEKITLK